MSAPGTEASRPPGTKAKARAETVREQLGEGHVSGNLTADPELRYTPTGRAVCRLRIAYNRRYQDSATGDWKDAETEFYSLDAWGLQAENCAEYLHKGDRIVVIGEWQRRTYDDTEGNTREVTEMQVRDVGPSLLFNGARVIRRQRSGGNSESR